MTTHTHEDDRIAKYIEQLEKIHEIEFIYNGITYSIEATYEKTGENTYRSDGRGFEIWKLENEPDNGTAIVFSESAADILNIPCFDGKTFVDIIDEIESA